MRFDSWLQIPHNTTLAPAIPAHQGLLQRSANGTTPSSVPPIVHDVLSSPGRPLDPGIRASMGTHFGHDFSQVRVHTDSRAAESARAVNALAYTVGKNVVFGTGQYAPGTSTGKKLLAHELTHVVQQINAPESASVSMDNAHEQQAEAVSAEAVNSKSTTLVDVVGSQSLARQAASYDEVKKQVLEELNRNMPVAIFGILDGLDPQTREALGADPDISQAIAKLPPTARNLIRKHMVLGKTTNKISDPREHVLATERVSYDSLRAFLRDVTQKISQLVKSGSPNKAWISSGNANVSSLLNLLNGLVADLDAELLIIRFDQEVTGNVGASYDYLNDLMHLQPFTSDASRAFVAARLVHEYAHVKQDRTLESKAATQTAPIEHTREAELQQEIEGRRVQVYFTRFLSELGIEAGANPDAVFQEELTTNVLFSSFEKERTGNKKEREQATKDVRSTVEKAYTEQLKTNAPTRMYVIQIDSQNHGLLYISAGGSPTDLGLIPANATTRVDLINHLTTAIRSLSTFASLFDGPTGSKTRLQVITFTVVYTGQPITQFGLEPTP